MTESSSKNHRETNPVLDITQGLVDILYFDRSQPEKDRKFRHPIRSEDLSQARNRDVILKDESFCKKNPDTLEQRRFRCNACTCQIYSLQGLREHFFGAKHKERVVQFKPDYAGDGKDVHNIDGISKAKSEKRPEKIKVESIMTHYSSEVRYLSACTSFVRKVCQWH